MSLLLLLACAHQPPAATPPVRVLTSGQDRSELVTEGPLEARLAPADDADLVLFYSGEERGSLDPCGCPTRPRGGVARQVSYVGATRDQPGAPPSLFLNGGYWLEDAMSLDGTPREDVPVLNRWMLDGLQHAELDALNVAYNDMAGLTSVGGGDPGVPAVSANVAGEGVVPWRRFEYGDLVVGVTGLTTPGLTFLPTPGFVVSDPFKAGRAVLEEMDAAGVDVSILMVYAHPDSARKLARTGLVDVIIDTNLHREQYPPLRVGDAVWVRSHFQTMRLGELRLGVVDGKIVWAHERKIDLDDEIPDQADAHQIAKAARKEIDRAQKAVFGR